LPKSISLHRLEQNGANPPARHSPSLRHVGHRVLDGVDMVSFNDGFSLANRFGQFKKIAQPKHVV
jgi:hypothetical protein